MGPRLLSVNVGLPREIREIERPTAGRGQVLIRVHAASMQAASVGSSGFITLTNFSPKRIKAGDEALINGAGGNVGTLAVQIAKARGARVTGVDHTSRLELIRSLGADRVVDYTKEDVLQGPERYDIILWPGRCSAIRICPGPTSRTCRTKVR